MSEVQLREIRKSFGDIRLLDRLNLTAKSGQYVVLLGPSGCGKTTILKMVAGLESPDAGEVLIGGKSANSLPPRKRDIAMVFQQDALYPHLSVRENLAFALGNSVDADQLQQRIDVAGKLAGIETILDRLPRALSGGESRRAAVAKAMVRCASIRLLDEPLSALDAPLRNALQVDLLHWHTTAGGTTLHVTHDGQEAMRMADMIAVIDDGRVIQAAASEEIYSHPVTRAVALAIGSPPINLVPARQSTTGTLQFADSSLRVQGSVSVGVAGGTEIEVGIRPESFFVIGDDDRRDGIRFDAEILRHQRVAGMHQFDVAAGTRRLLATLPSATAPPLGDRCTLFVRGEDVHLFEASSGRRLGSCSDG